jgi:cytoskeleton protein RodZ
MTSTATSPQSAMPDSARGIGERLRKAREQAGMSLTDVSARSKMPKHVIEALEREDWAHLGAPVYARGQLRSYAKLLGMPADAIVDNLEIPASKPAELVPQTYTPKIQRVAEQAKMRLVYVVLTAAIAVPVWLATRSHINYSAENTVPLEVSGDAALAIPGDAQPPNGPQSAAAQPEPLVASMAPLPQAPAAAPAGELIVRFADESWISLAAPDGSVIERALVQPGQERSFGPGQIGKAVLGNASAVTVLYRGQPVDLTPYVRANVVRFTVSSEGSLQPVER